MTPEYWTQVYLTLSLLLGIIGGEFVSRRSFGRLKSTALYFLDLLIFVLVLTAALGVLGYYKFELSMHLLIYFVVAFCSGVFTRGVTLVLGFSTKSPEEVPVLGRIFSRLVKKVTVSRLAEAMARLGFSRKDITSLLIELGLSAPAAQTVASDLKISAGAYEAMALDDHLTRIEKRLEKIESAVVKTPGKGREGK